MIKQTTAQELSEITTEKAAQLTTPLTDAANSVYRTAGENVGLTLIGGLAVGVAIGALLPFGRSRNRPKKAARALVATLTATVSELSRSLAAQARERVESTAGDAGETLGNAGRAIGKNLHENSENLAKQTKKLADDAADQLNDSGKAIAGQLVKLIGKVRR